MSPALEFRNPSVYSKSGVTTNMKTAVAHKLSHKDCFGDYADSLSHQKCMRNNFKPMTGISNQFSKGKPSCQKFGTQMCLSVGWGPPTAGSILGGP